jgi:hypothetical protein
MTTTKDASPAAVVLPAARRTSVRLHLLGRSTVLMLTSMTGVALFCLWITLVAVSPITIVAVLVLPATALVRGYAAIHRRAAAGLLGTPIEPHYRSTEGRGLIGRVWTIERDPASWRDAWWLLAHAVVAFVTSVLSFTLFASSLFYLIYPFLYWVTPENVFNRPFGDWWMLHSVGQSTVVMLAAPVMFGLWYLLQIPLARAELSVTRSLLG